MSYSLKLEFLMLVSCLMDNGEAVCAFNCQAMFAVLTRIVCFPVGCNRVQTPIMAIVMESLIWGNFHQNLNIENSCHISSLGLYYYHKGLIIKNSLLHTNLMICSYILKFRSFVT